MAGGRIRRPDDDQVAAVLDLAKRAGHLAHSLERAVVDVATGPRWRCQHRRDAIAQRHRRTLGLAGRGGQSKITGHRAAARMVAADRCPARDWPGAPRSSNWDLPPAELEESVPTEGTCMAHPGNPISLDFSARYRHRGGAERADHVRLDDGSRTAFRDVHRRHRSSSRKDDPANLFDYRLFEGGALAHLIARAGAPPSGTRRTAGSRSLIASPAISAATRSLAASVVWQ